MKKIKIWGLIAIMFLLTACNERTSNETEQESNSTITQETSTQNTTPTLENNDPDNGSYLPYYLVWYGLEVALIDFTTGEKMGTFAVEEDVVLWNFFNLSNGYFALLVEHGLGDGLSSIIWDEEGNQTIIDGSGNEINPDDINLRMLILNNELTIVDDLEITNEDLQDITVRFGMDVVYEEGQIVIYYVTDWWVQMLQDYEELQSIRRYNLHAGVTDELFKISDTALLLEKVRRMTPEVIAFTGTALHSEIDALRYGFINLTTGEIVVFEESAFPINSYDRLHTSNSTVLIREELAPPTMGVWGAPISVLRGEVVVFNVSTRENRLIQLDGLESHWATLSLDGRYVVTVDPTFSYFRKYDISSGNLAVEYAINMQGDRVREITALPDGRYGIRIATEDGTIHFNLVTLP